MPSFDVIIIGAGAAGLMCAITAGARAKRVLLLDHNAQAGAKILISGGGRCNFTNTGTSPQNFLSENPHFCRSALSRYKPSDFLALMAKHNIAWHEKTLGQLFCDGSAKQVVAMLLAECAAADVTVKLATKVTGIRKSDGFTVETADETYTAPALVLATGGLSIPKMGATGFSYEVARKFGLKVITPRPALVPLKAKPDRAGVLQKPLRCFASGNRDVRQGFISGKHSLHPSRPFRSGHPADLVLLARGPIDPALILPPALMR